MIRKSPLNGRLIAAGVASAVAIWAGAFLLPDLVPAPSPAQSTAPSPAATTASGPHTALAAAPIDPAAFGSLQMSMAPAAPPPRASILEAVGPVPLTSLSLASPLQSIGATFAEPVAGVGLPELGGASALDGPADAGLDSPVAKSSEADIAGPSVPPPRGKIIAIDASEGTKIDPLRQRNWDLNAVQVIPPMPKPAPTPAQPKR